MAPINVGLNVPTSPQSPSAFGQAAPAFRVGPKEEAAAASGWNPPPAASTPVAATPVRVAHPHRWKDEEEVDKPVDPPTPALQSVSLNRPAHRMSADDEAEKKLEKLLVPVGLAAGGLLICLAIGLTLYNQFSRPTHVAKNPTSHNTHVTHPSGVTPPVNEQPTPVKPPVVITPPTPMPEPETPKAEPTPVKPKPTPKPEKPEMEEPEAMPVKPTPEPMPKPEPPPMPKPEVEKPTREEVHRLAKALTDARTALADQNTDEADDLLRSVMKMKMLPEHRLKFERLQELSRLVDQCVIAIQMTIPTFEAGSVLTIGGSTQISIVEANKEHLIIRRNGSNTTYKLDEIPLGLSIALADRSLDSNEPVNLVVKGAFVLARARDDAARTKAHEWFAEAKARGVKDVDRLMPVFDDKYDNMEADLK